LYTVAAYTIPVTGRVSIRCTRNAIVRKNSATLILTSRGARPMRRTATGYTRDSIGMTIFVGRELKGKSKSKGREKDAATNR
jgi:hypothetical protein